MRYKRYRLYKADKDKVLLKSVEIRIDYCIILIVPNLYVLPFTFGYCPIYCQQQ